MKQLVYVFSFIIFLIMACCTKEEFPDNCKGFSAGTYKHGYSFAKGSYKDFGDYAIFIRDRIADTINGGWIHDKIEKSISLNSIDEFCAEKIRIGIKNIKLNINDTITLKYSHLGLSQEYPTADLDFIDADAVLEQYDLIKNVYNWIIIDSINSDTTEIKGQFKLSFVTNYEPYLNGEKERWDDPKRPDTLRFTNGEFRAEFTDF